MNQLQMINRMLLGGVDTDAQAFIDATGITDSTIITAIFKLVADLKSANIWNLEKAIYPFVGGTAFTHKFNLKDPRDLDVAFRITEIGINTHDSNGVTMNGVNGSLQTHFIPLSQMTTANGRMTLYQRDNRPNRICYDIGKSGGGFGLVTKYESGESYFMFGGGYGATIANPDSRGFYMTNRANTMTEGYKNGIRIVNSSQSATLVQEQLLIGSLPNGAYTTSNYAYVSFGNSLTQSDALVYYNIIQEFQTTLGRAV